MVSLPSGGHAPRGIVCVVLLIPQSLLTAACLLSYLQLLCITLLMACFGRGYAQNADDSYIILSVSGVKIDLSCIMLY